MAIPAVSDFRDRFPEFTSFTNAQVQRVLGDAQLWIDQDLFAANDFFLAVLYWTAHMLALSGMVASGDSPYGLLGELDLYINSIRFGERNISFGKRGWGMSGGKSPGEEMLSYTLYGQLFLQLRYRNVPGVLVV